MHKGDIAILDPKNKLNISGDKIVYVKVVGIRNFFPRCYNCFICDRNGEPLNDNILPIYWSHLVKVKNKQAPMVIIRYNENIPVFNQTDLDVLEALLTVGKQYIPKNRLNRVLLFVEKVKFYAGVITQF